MGAADQGVVDQLFEARAAEKRQTLFYRGVAGEAESMGDEVVAERVNGLLADEQHHLSRLSARLLELGIPLPDVAHVEPPEFDYGRWEVDAAAREEEELRRYEAIPLESLDARTAELIQAILEAERQHVRALGGKWMSA